MQKYGKRGRLILTFCVFAALFLANLFIPVSGEIGATARMWLILNGCVLLASAALLIKYGLPSKRSLVLSLVLGALMFAAYRGVNFASVKGFASVFMCCAASLTVFERYPENALKMLKARCAPDIWKSAAIGVGAGAAIGVVNILLSGKPVRFEPNAECFVTALSPAILEEICYRALLYALCLALLGGRIQSRREGAWCYFIMIAPHVLIHTPDVFLKSGVISGIVTTLVLTLLAGLPLALLQKKRDIASAMLAHGVIDLLRFCLTGLPY